MKVNWLVVDTGLWVYIITSLLNASMVSSWVVNVAMILPLIHCFKKAFDEMKKGRA